MPLVLTGAGEITGLTSVPSSGLQLADANMPTGSVLQVVSNTYATIVSSTTSTFVDTGLTATITPTSATSKILVSVSQNGIQKTTNSGAYMRLVVLRNSTVIGTPAATAGYTASAATNYIGSLSGTYLDSPATTSAIVYKTQFKSEGNSATVSVQGDSEQSTITLMEIAA